MKTNLQLGWMMAAVALAILAGGCTGDARNKTLTFFFDGVPQGKGTNIVADGKAEEKPSAKELAKTSGAPGQPPVSLEVVHYHQPWLNQECGSCHESKFSQKMRGSMKQVCFDCHDDFLKDAKVKHSPVDSGECTSCHDPHQSPNKALLVKTGKNLCLECHDDLPAKAKYKHSPVESGECLSCHSPHASAHKKLVLKDTKKLCLECHDDFTAQIKVQHSPVESGECLSCHAAHHSDNKGLLVKKGKSLCFECHDDFLEKAAFKHSAVDDCYSCHKAHGSNETALLTKPKKDLCMECHETKDLAGSTGHANLTTKACIDCHDPHTGKDKFLLKAPVRASAK